MSDSTPTSVYLYYDDSDWLIYVGITSRATTRQSEHQSKEWWPLVVRQEVEHFSDRPQALRRESELIRSFEPPFNTQQNPRCKTIRDEYSRYLAARQRFNGQSLREAIAAARPITLTPFDVGGRLAFRTQVEDYMVARAIRMEEKVLVTGVVTSKIVETQQRGPFLLLVTCKPFRTGEVGHGTAKVGFMQNVKPQWIALRAVTCTRALPQGIEAI